jgi:hypothetical protein
LTIRSGKEQTIGLLVKKRINPEKNKKIQRRLNAISLILTTLIWLLKVSLGITVLGDAFDIDPSPKHKMGGLAWLLLMLTRVVQAMKTMMKTMTAKTLRLIHCHNHSSWN